MQGISMHTFFVKTLKETKGSESQELDGGARCVIQECTVSYDTLADAYGAFMSTTEHELYAAMEVGDNISIDLYIVRDDTHITLAERHTY